MRKNRKWLGKKIKKVKYPNPEPMAGGSRRGLTFHNEGVDRKCGGSGTHWWLAKYVNNKRIPYHFIWCPHCGDIIQLIACDKAARSMKGGDVDGRGNSANKAGAVNIQVCVASYGKRPFTGSPMKNAAVFGRLADSWGIKHRLRSKWGPGVSRKKAIWAKGGIQGHCHGPHDDHVDPMAINPKKLSRALWPKDVRSAKKKRKK